MTRHDRKHWIRLPARDPKGIRRAVDEELETHLAMRTEDLVRSGMRPDAARRLAEEEFGDRGDATAYCAAMDEETERRHRWRDSLGDVKQDVLHVARLLGRAPGFMLATVVTLALALATSVIAYGVLHAYLLKPLPFPEPERLVSFEEAPVVDRTRRPRLEGVDWGPVAPLFESVVAWDIDGFTLVGGEYTEVVTGAWVTEDYFETLGIASAWGRTFSAEEFRDEAPVALLSHDLWWRRFRGDPALIGQAVTMHSADHPGAPTVVTIVGILPPDYWPIQWRESGILRPIRADGLRPALARLATGVTAAETEERLNAVVRAQLPATVDSTWRLLLRPPLARTATQIRPMLIALMGAALLMLLSACGSVAGALVSRLATRRGELAMRLALGASHGRLVRQVLVESLTLGAVAGLLGLALAHLVLGVGGPLVERQVGAVVPGGVASLRPDGMVMLFAVAVSALTGLTLGGLAALALLRSSLRAAASGVLGVARGPAPGRGGAGIRRALIAGQMAVVMVLLFGAGLMVRTVLRMEAVDLGFRTDNIVIGSLLLPSARYADSADRRLVMDRVLQGFRATPGTRGAALAYPTPFAGPAWQMPVLAEGGVTDEDAAPAAMVYTVSPDYFAVLGIPVRAGRVFGTGDDHASPLVVVVSERLARTLAPDGDVLGRRIRVRVPHLPSFNDEDPRPWRTVIGVVGETQKDFEERVTPDVYVPYSQNPRPAQSVVLAVDPPVDGRTDALRQALLTVDPTLSLNATGSLRALIAARGAQRRGLTILLSVGGAIALALAALALYASLAYTVQQRRAELAVRRAVGASNGAILRLVAGEGLGMVSTGVVIGGAAALTFRTVLQAHVYGVPTADAVTLLAIVAVLGATAVLACVVPALRALRTDPVLALRE